MSRRCGVLAETKLSETYPMADDLHQDVGWSLYGVLALMDPGLAVHSARGAAIAMSLAIQAEVEVDEAMFWGFVLHDIGTLALPLRILSKPSPLTTAERHAIGEHPLRGARILEETPGLEEAVGIVLHHHERWDGEGYPNRLAESRIPIGSRLLAIGDTFAALTSPRPYRAAKTPEEAVAIITIEAGGHFDPRLVELFETIPDRLPEPLRRPRGALHLPGVTQLGVLTDRAQDLSRGKLEALVATAIGMRPEEAALRCGRSAGTHRNWVSSLRRSLACPARKPLPRFLASLGQQVFDAAVTPDIDDPSDTVQETPSAGWGIMPSWPLSDRHATG